MPLLIDPQPNMANSEHNQDSQDEAYLKLTSTRHDQNHNSEPQSQSQSQSDPKNSDSNLTSRSKLNPDLPTQQPDPPERAPTPPSPSLRHSPSNLPTHNTLTTTVLARHSTRVFHTDIPVPMETLHQCLYLAQYAPSSTNIQPWRLTFTSGPKLEKLRSAMVAAATGDIPSAVPPIPSKFKHYRSSIGHALYGPEGYNIPRSDTEGTKKAQLRNFEFFGAPLVAVVGLDESLAKADILSVGLYVQTLVLLLTERGLGTCLQVSTAGYPDVLRRELGIGENMTVLCTLAIGFEDASQHINVYKMPRDEWRNSVDFVME